MKKDLINDILFENVESLQNIKQCLERNIKYLNELFDKVHNDAPFTADDRFFLGYMLCNEIWEDESKISDIDEKINAIDEYIGETFKGD